MKFIIVAVIIAVVVIVIIKLRDKKRQSEYEALKERVHNSGIIKDLTDYLQIHIAHHDMDWSYKQTNYYDDCERSIAVFDEGINFYVWEDSHWRTMCYIDFVGDLGYKPLSDNALSDNGLLAGTKYTTVEDVFRVFTAEVLEVVKKVFNDDEIEYCSSIKYYNEETENQKQPNGTYKRVKLRDRHGSIEYKVPKSAGAKQI